MKNEIQVYPGDPFPLGATYDGNGVNFAIYSENGKGVDLCLFDSSDDTKETHRIKISERTHHVWHVYIPGLTPGQLYGYRVHGDYDPANGLRFNPNKLLMDPYAKALSGSIKWDNALFSYEIGHDDQDFAFSDTDSAPFIPKSVVVDQQFDWEGDRAPKVAYNRSIIYETHVRGFTKLHPEIPEEIRGSYAAIGHPVTINYLKELGITAIELMPVHQYVNDRYLVEKELNNYWGYSSIGFFAPDVRYSSSGFHGEQVKEFKAMVKALHKEGIEVILDVVYNHTAEGNHLGPTLCFRGVDNASYYRLTEDRRFYMDYTGCGNTLNTQMPAVLRLIMDSLRYWITDMHVDGFRFDLASTLARELHEVNQLSAFFDIIYQDPVISQVKLIAEPWDIGEGGYMVGKFPGGWAEWNGKYRDSIRDYWRSAESMLGEFAERISGSSDLYKEDYRRPTASINFITAHDGFTLNDLVSYNEKHNEANKEDNNDGDSHNRSWNCGVEGPTDDPEINQLRQRQKKNFLTTLFLSQGIPMLVAGDEISRTQGGNNNAYCQDNEISWLDWAKADQDLLHFTRKVIQLRSGHPVFCRQRWFKGKPVGESGLPDIAWFLPDGREMPDENWAHDFAKSLGMFLNGKSIREVGPKGEPIVDDSFYILFNAADVPLDYKIPEEFGSEWTEVLNTYENIALEGGKTVKGGESIEAPGRSVIVLMRPLEEKNG
jgi:isoamylase